MEAETQEYKNVLLYKNKPLPQQGRTLDMNKRHLRLSNWPN